MAKPKRRSQAATIEALRSAVEDIRENGREGRTVQEVADKYGCNVGSLRTKLYEAGLTNLGSKLQSGVQSEIPEAQKPDSEPDSRLVNLANSLDSQQVSELLTKSVENRGNEGVTTDPIASGHIARSNHADSALVAVDAEILEAKRDVVRTCKRLMREAKSMIEIKSVRDYRTIYDTLMDALGAKEQASSAKGSLIQVNILSDSGSRTPRAVRVIEAETVPNTDFTTDSVPVEAETLTA